MGSARKNFREEPLPAQITKVINLHIFVECRVVFRPLEREKGFKSAELLLAGTVTPMPTAFSGPV